MTQCSSTHVIDVVYIPVLCVKHVLQVCYTCITGV